MQQRCKRGDACIVPSENKLFIFVKNNQNFKTIRSLSMSLDVNKDNNNAKLKLD